MCDRERKSDDRDQNDCCRLHRWPVHLFQAAERTGRPVRRDAGQQRGDEVAQLLRGRHALWRRVQRHNQLQHHVGGPSHQSCPAVNEKEEKGTDYQHRIGRWNWFRANEGRLRSNQGILYTEKIYNI